MDVTFEDDDDDDDDGQRWRNEDRYALCKLYRLPYYWWSRTPKKYIIVMIW